MIVITERSLISSPKQQNDEEILWPIVSSIKIIAWSPVLNPFLTTSLLFPVNTVAVLMMVSIAVFRYRAGQSELALLLLLAAVLILSITLYAVKGGDRFRPENISALAYSLTIVIVFYENFDLAGYWLLVILSLNFYLVNVRVALTLDVLIIVAVMPVALKGFNEAADLFSYIGAILTATILGVIHFVRARQYTLDLERWSFQDPLTHLYTRRRLNEDFQSAQASKVRHDEPATLMIIDIDHFKQVNDRLGHEAGDRILVKLAQLLYRELRVGSETVYRVGGDEFVVLMKKTSLHQSITVANRLREQVQRDITSADGRVTISIGGTELEKTDSWQSCFERADQALYRAKQNGRNRVEDVI